MIVLAEVCICAHKTDLMKAVSGCKSRYGHIMTKKLYKVELIGTMLTCQYVKNSQDIRAYGTKGGCKLVEQAPLKFAASVEDAAVEDESIKDCQLHQEEIQWYFKE